MKTHDNARRAVLELRNTASKALRRAVKLDDKIRMQRLQKKLDAINKDLITIVFDCEDAEEFVKNTILA
jgi:hypothetical protein